MYTSVHGQYEETACRNDVDQAADLLVGWRRRVLWLRICFHPLSLLDFLGFSDFAMTANSAHNAETIDHSLMIIRGTNSLVIRLFSRAVQTLMSNRAVTACTQCSAARRLHARVIVADDKARRPACDVPAPLLRTMGSPSATTPRPDPFHLFHRFPFLRYRLSVSTCRWHVHVASQPRSGRQYINGVSTVVLS